MSGTHGEHCRLPIASTWDGRAITDGSSAVVSLDARDEGLEIRIESPYFGDPRPPGPARDLDGLWCYEVVELLLAQASAKSESVRYIELEVSPHGHTLLLLFAGVRRRFARLPIRAHTEIAGARWRGRVRLPWATVPPGPLVANAFAVNGAGDERRYLAMHPMPGPRPDFHQPSRFPPIPILRRSRDPS